MKTGPLSLVHAVAFDLDGTLYLGNRAVDGAAELVQKLRSRGLRVLFLTNNSTKTRRAICDKLNALNIHASPEEIYSAARGVALFLKQEGRSPVYCFGTDGLREEMEAAGVDLVSDPKQASVVVIGLDMKLDYEGISRLLPLRGRKCLLVACNRDLLFPSDAGAPSLGCGFVASVVELVLERKIDYVVGKPNTFLLDLLAQEQGVSMDEILIVGDSLESDIAMAGAAGCLSVHLSTDIDGAAQLRISTLSELEALFG